MARKGEIPAKKIGKKWIFEKEQINIGMVLLTVREAVFFDNLISVEIVAEVLGVAPRDDS